MSCLDAPRPAEETHGPHSTASSLFSSTTPLTAETAPRPATPVDERRVIVLNSADFGCRPGRIVIICVGEGKGVCVLKNFDSQDREVTRAAAADPEMVERVLALERPRAECAGATWLEAIE